jgi:hypothetical protein
MKRTSMIMVGLILAGCETTGADPTVSESQMAALCRSEAAKQFSQRPEDLMTIAMEPSVDGYSIFGQWPIDRVPQGIFVCRFDAKGMFRSVARS